MNLLSIFGIVFFYFTLVNGESMCNKLSSCGECIGYASEKCVWCSQDTNIKLRCQPESFVKSIKGKWCNGDFTYNPDPKKTIALNAPFNSDLDGVRVQFKPQIINIKARPGVPVNFKMSYEPAVHFPLDVYYLMDNSFTMIKHKKELQDQANVIYEELTKLTNNVRLGVGSFVEKPGFPYVNTTSGTGSYAFRNHLSLNKDVQLFKNVFADIPFEANWDDPEASLDALMQAMACEQNIGWRNGSRRIIVLCTDSTYHSAGDGKMIGIIKPNDMKCNIENNMYKLNSLNQDYPSVSQINKVATEGKFIIIFAAVKAVRDEYTLLAKQILGAKYAELKSESNIIEIIKESYLKSVRALRLDFDLPPFVELTLDPDCKAEGNVRCESTHSDPTVNIDATVVVKMCPPEKRLQEFIISPVGLQDKLTVVLNVDCTCDCEKIIQNTTSSKCSNAGFLQCGICKCNDASYGSECQCNRATLNAMMVDLDKCKLDKGDTNLCSGKGTCMCGKCKCNTGYSGEHCEFDDESCPRSEVFGLCSGNGICHYGKCNCKPDWSGDDCACTKSEQNCITLNSKEVCSGNGECKCGKCQCNKIEGKNESYSGVFCDYCEDCASKYCEKLENYVECIYNSNKVDCDKKFNDTNNIEVQMVSESNMNPSNWPMSTWCRKKLDGGTAIVFLYNHDPTTRQLNLIIQKELDTSARAKVWIAVGSAIGAVLLIGLLTVIGWKVLVDLHDAREFKKFEERAVANGFDVSLNPLYENPNINFTNPAYQTIG